MRDSQGPGDELGMDRVTVRWDSILRLPLSPTSVPSSHQSKQGLSIQYVPGTVLSTSHMNSASPHHIPETSPVLQMQMSTEGK